MSVQCLLRTQLSAPSEVFTVMFLMVVHSMLDFLMVGSTVLTSFQVARAAQEKGSYRVLVRLRP